MEKRRHSFSIENSTPRSSRHNSRADKPKYLISNSRNNFYKKYNLYQSDKQFLELSMQLYKDKIGQRMQELQKSALIKEAVISLESQHTEKDIHDLFYKLNKEYGGHKILELAIHRDEGHFIDEEGKTYYPNSSIFFNKNNKNWYLNPKFTKDTKKLKLKKIMNYHAHVKFTMMNDTTGKTSRMNKGDYSNRHKLVANSLNMRYSPSADRLIKRDISEVKSYHDANRVKNSKIIKKISKKSINSIQSELKDKKKIQNKDLDLLKKEYRQKMIDDKELYTKESYRKLHNLFKIAKENNRKQELEMENVIFNFEQLQIELLAEEHLKEERRLDIEFGKILAEQNEHMYIEEKEENKLETKIQDIKLILFNLQSTKDLDVNIKKIDHIDKEKIETKIQDIKVIISKMKSIEDLDIKVVEKTLNEDLIDYGAKFKDSSTSLSASTSNHHKNKL